MSGLGLAPRPASGGIEGSLYIERSWNAMHQRSLGTQLELIPQLTETKAII